MHFSCLPLRQQLALLTLLPQSTLRHQPWIKHLIILFPFVLSSALYGLPMIWERYQPYYPIMDFLTVLDWMKKFILSSSCFKITHQCVMPLPFPFSRRRARPSAQITVINPYFYHRSLRNEGEPATKSASLPLFPLLLTANFACSHCCKISRA